MIRRHVVVRGRVQGVGFRQGVWSRAEGLHVSGWVRNRPDGAVEAELEGAPEHVEALLAWFGHGPRGARVDAVEADELPPLGERGFRVRG